MLLNFVVTNNILLSQVLRGIVLVLGHELKHRGSHACPKLNLFRQETTGFQMA